MARTLLLLAVVATLTIVTAGDNVFKSVLVSTKMGSDECKDGFRYKEGYGCEDIDECREQVPCTLIQTCRNFWGSYSCMCPRGFKKNHRTGECDDIDECKQGYCGNGQKCINTVGSFTCDCQQGMKRIGRFCRDINECMHSPCHDNQYCLNTRASYICQCKAGYRDNGDGTCVDVNECLQGMCGAMGETCRNTIGSYECICKQGYQKDDRTNGRYCTDIDECKSNRTCPPYSECTNIQGSFLCRCHRGFKKINGYCVDDRECASGEGKKCQWRCLDLPGSYKCQCPDGYDQIQFNCIDINECDRHMQHKCTEAEACVNTRGGYECVKPPKCPQTASGSSIYRKVMKTDEFGYRQFPNTEQVTTNICRRQRCGKLQGVSGMSLQECKAEPLSVSYHYIAIGSNLPLRSRILHVSFPARRRRQRYNFSIVQGNERSIFTLKQTSMYQPRAQLKINAKLTGPSKHIIKIDMATYHQNGNMRDSRMLTVTVYVSRYEF